MFRRTSKAYEEIGYLPFIEEPKIEERFDRLRKILQGDWQPSYTAQKVLENCKWQQAHSMSPENRV
jgi:hypothetical protein